MDHLINERPPSNRCGGSPGRTPEEQVSVLVPIPVLVTALLTIHAGLLCWAAIENSPTYDEVGHLPAGISIWYFGRFDLYGVNPPLVKLMASLPVVLAGPEVDWSRFQELERPEWSVGRDFVAANGDRAFWFFTLARWACIPLSLLGGYVCYRWATELYGHASGLLATILWCFSPNLIAHASLITPDVGASALGVASFYLFWRWLIQPDWWRAVCAGLALGLAELTKTTWIVLFGLWPTLWLVWRLSRTTGRHGFLRQPVQLMLILFLGVYMLNAGYGFEGTFQKLDQYTFVSKTLGGSDLDKSTVRPGGNRFAGGWFGELSVPLPKDYVSGIDLQKRGFEQKRWSYLGGEHRLGGWWYYYIYALLVKVPLGAWLLIALAAGIGWTGRYSAGWLHEIVLIAPIVVILSLASSQTGISRHLRYVLPLFPYVIISISRLARSFAIRDWKVSAITGASVCWIIASSLSVYPCSLSYFNELAGGPKGGHHHLIDSNIDWCQDMYKLKNWSDSNPRARPLYVDCFGSLGPEHYKIEHEAAPGVPAPGWYALSVHRLHEREGKYGHFLDIEPIAILGYSIYIYNLNCDDVSRISREREGWR